VNETLGDTDEGLTRTASMEAATPAGVARFLRQRIEFGEDSLLLAEAGTRGVLDSLVRFRSRPGSAAAPGALERPPAAPSLAAAGRSAAPEPMAPPAPGADLSLPGTLEEVEKVCAGCVRCGLAESRTQTVFADGNPDARVMVVGEAPGANEDATGQPFVGAAGKFLDLLLRTVGLSRRDSVYICNVIKCRPPGNRNPESVEIESCAPYLRRQIELVRPEVILAVGTFSGQLLTGRDDTLGRLRGKVFRYEGIPLVVTYHPAALLRNSGWTRPTWEDLQLLRRILDGEDVPT
jgi:uracil-DNA glycosylase